MSDISIAGGYNNDVAGAYRWRTPTQLVYPALIVADIGEVVEQLNYPVTSRTLAILVQGIIKAEYVDGDEIGLLATSLIADIERALMQDICRDNNAVNTILTANQTFIGTPDSPYLTVEVSLEIKYRTLFRDPETAK